MVPIVIVLKGGEGSEELFNKESLRSELLGLKTVISLYISSNSQVDRPLLTPETVNKEDTDF
jgi:hypothetical protein